MDKTTHKFKFKIPHVYVILLTIIVICTILSYLVPAGQYSMVDLDGREVIDASTYTEIEQTPVDFVGLMKAVPQGMVDTATIIFFIFIVGGAFGVIESTGAVEAGIAQITRKLQGRERLIIPIVMLVFSLGGAIIGLAEETLPFIPIMVSFAIALGFDSITGVAIVLVGAGAGFAGAFMNPFTVGVGQGIAGLPLFSGIGFRIVMYLCMTTLCIAFVYRYSGKVKKNPQLSLMYELDKERDLNTDISQFKEFGTREKVVLMVLAATIAILVYGVLRQGWYLTEIAGLFLVMAIVVALVSKMGLNGFAEQLSIGMANIAGGALVVGFARGILVVLDQGHILHTLLYYSAAGISYLPSAITTLGIYVFQCLLNFLIPSGSGQAAVSLPLLCPLSDMVGITRQTAVLAYQLGDGISNIFTPTSGYFMAGLALAKVPWIKWAKWILPLILLEYLLGAVFVVIANAIHLGPF